METTNENIQQVHGPGSEEFEKARFTLVQEAAESVYRENKVVGMFQEINIDDRFSKEALLGLILITREQFRSQIERLSKPKKTRSYTKKPSSKRKSKN